MAQIDAILSAAERQALTADRLSRTYALELARVRDELDRRLAELAVDALRGQRTATALAARALQLREEIRVLLALAGYDDLAVTATSVGFEQMIAAIQELRLASQVAAFTSVDATRIAALQRLAQLDLLAEGDAVSTAVWRAVLRGAYADQPASELIQDLALITQRELRHVETFYDTGVSIFARQVQELKATNDPNELLLYAGPIDTRTRRFCLERAGKVFRRSEIETWDNGNLPGPPELVCGGYNCRHLLAPISQLSELAALAGTDQRVPEMATEYARVLAGKRKAA